MAYARIDAIRSIRAMRRELLDLEPAFRREVILRALEYSHHQFAWRFFAGQFGVERSLWPKPVPTQEEHETYAADRLAPDYAPGTTAHPPAQKEVEEPVTTPLRIYVASSWRNEARQQLVVKTLRAYGYSVYDFRNPAPANTGFSWRSCATDEQLRDAHRFRDEVLTTDVAQAGFRSDMDALRAADATVLVLPCGRSAHLELGYAVGAGQGTIALLDDPMSEPELMVLMCGRVCVTVDEVVSALAEWEELRVYDGRAFPRHPRGCGREARGCVPECPHYEGRSPRRLVPMCTADHRYTIRCEVKDCTVTYLLPENTTKLPADWLHVPAWEGSTPPLPSIFCPAHAKRVRAAYRDHLGVEL